jgi:hypothetical protein
MDENDTQKNALSRQVEALWTGYKKRELEGTMMGGDGGALGPPTACLVLPTLDRGAKLFGGKSGYESGMASRYLPSTPSVFGFFANGVLGKLGGSVAGDGDGDSMLHGSSSQYVVFRSKTGRPLYSPPRATEEADAIVGVEAGGESASRMLAAREDEDCDESRPPLFPGKCAPSGDDDDDDDDDVGDRSSGSALVGGMGGGGGGAPRSEDGELVVRRREIHSGRALSVSTVEWSVAEKTARPTSALEGYMWEKETQVDRLRERVPLAQVRHVLLFRLGIVYCDPTRIMPRLKRGIASRTLFAAHDEYEGGDDRSGVSQAEGLDRVGEEGRRRWQIRYHTGEIVRVILGQ